MGRTPEAKQEEMNERIGRVREIGKEGITAERGKDKQIVRETGREEAQRR